MSATISSTKAIAYNNPFQLLIPRQSKEIHADTQKAAELSSCASIVEAHLYSSAYALRAVARSFFETFAYLAQCEVGNAARCFVWSILGIGYVILGSLFPKTIYGSFSIDPVQRKDPEMGQKPTLSKTKQVLDERSTRFGRVDSPRSLRPGVKSPDSSPKSDSPRDDDFRPGNPVPAFANRPTSFPQPAASRMPTTHHQDKAPQKPESFSVSDNASQKARAPEAERSTDPFLGVWLRNADKLEDTLKAGVSSLSRRDSSPVDELQAPKDPLLEPFSFSSPRNAIRFSSSVDISTSQNHPSSFTVPRSNGVSFVHFDAPSSVRGRASVLSLHRDDAQPKHPVNGKRAGSQENSLRDLLADPVWSIVSEYCDLRESASLMRQLYLLEDQDSDLDIELEESGRLMEQLRRTKALGGMRRGLVKQCILKSFPRDLPQRPEFQIISEEQGLDGGTTYGVKVSLRNLRSTNKERATKDDVNPQVQKAFNLIVNSLRDLQNYGVLGSKDKVVIRSVDCRDTDLSARSIFNGHLDLRQIHELDFTRTRITIDLFSVLHRVPNLQKLTLDYSFRELHDGHNEHKESSGAARYRKPQRNKALSELARIPGDTMSDTQKAASAINEVLKQELDEIYNKVASLPNVQGLSLVGVMVDVNFMMDVGWFKTMSKLFPEAVITFTPMPTDYQAPTLAIPESRRIDRLLECGHAVTQREASQAQNTQRCPSQSMSHVITRDALEMRPSATVKRDGTQWKGDVLIEDGAIVHYGSPKCKLVFNPSTTQKLFGEDPEEVIEKGRKCPHCTEPFTKANTKRITA